ncbi:MAG: SBBP repeat-containing protein [Candidatus Hodarchaeales archaeon]|jgi:hypothetical protein
MKNKKSVLIWMGSLLILTMVIVPFPIANAEKNETGYETHLNLGFSTYLGGTGGEVTPDFALDENDNIYVTGYSDFDSSSGSDFPMENAYNPIRSNNSAAVFVAKLTPDGQNFFFSTWIGGLGSSGGPSLKIALDYENNIIIGGSIMESNNFDFPITTNALNQSINGDSDIFIAKLSNDGSSLLYSTVLGGSGNDFFWDLSTDSSGNIYITGMAGSADFPTTEGAFDTNLDGFDIFVTKLSPEGSSYQIRFSTFLGGTSTEDTSSIAVDSMNNIIISGATISNDFPLTTNALNTTYNAPYSSCWVYPGGLLNECGNMFISKISPDGSELLYSTYISGIHEEYPSGIVVDSSNNIIVTGTTQSSDFPITKNAYKNEISDRDAFLLKLSSDGSELLYSTYVGGTAADFGSGVDLDKNSNIIMTGSTGSNDFSMTQEALGPSKSFNTFIFKVSSNGTVLNSAVLGGSSVDSSSVVHADSNGDLVVIGGTMSLDFPIQECLLCEPQGSDDLVLFKLVISDSDPPEPDPVPLDLIALVLAVVIILVSFPLIYAYKKKKA